MGAASSQIHALETARDAAQAELAAAQEAITALETRLRVAEKEATKAGEGGGGKAMVVEVGTKAGESMRERMGTGRGSEGGGADESG